MKQFIGKMIVRTKARSNGDRSYMSDPSLVIAVGEHHAIIKTKWSDKNSILPADLMDEHWEEVLPELFEKAEERN